MGKVVLWIGVALGVLLLLLGGIDLLGSTQLTEPEAGRAVRGGVYLILIGGTFIAGCVIGILRRGRVGKLLPVAGPVVWEAPPPLAGARPNLSPAKNAEAAYVRWYRWAEAELGGDSVRLHPAVTVALLQLMWGRGAVAAAEAARGVAAEVPPAARRPRKASRGHVVFLARIGASLLPLLAPGERVLASTFGQPSNQIGMFLLFGAILGRLISSSFFVTVTDQRLIVIAVSNMSMRPIGLDRAEPRLHVQSLLRGRPFGGRTLTFTNLSDGRRLKLLMDRRWRREADAVAAAAATPPVALTGAWVPIPT